MIRLVETRWNSLVQVIDRALKLEDALKKLFGLSAHNTGVATAHLKRFKLSTDEWKLLRALKPLLMASASLFSLILNNFFP